MSVEHLRRVRRSSLKSPVYFEGVGLHSGAVSQLSVHPAASNTGIVFRQKSVPEGGFDADAPAFSDLIPASSEHVIRYDHGTTLANAYGASVATVEHLMAALAVAQIDNALIEIDGPEVPILDGSAAPFLNKFNEVGVRYQRAAREELVIKRPQTVVDGERSISFEPSDTFSLHIEIEFEDCLIGQQTASICLENAEEIARMASARTFCRLYEIDALRRAGLIRGGSLDNSVVVDGERLLNEAGLRDPKEFVLHKALDLIGDLYLLGMPIRGTVRAVRPGHDINCRAALQLFRDYLQPQIAVAQG